MKLENKNLLNKITVPRFRGIVHISAFFCSMVLTGAYLIFTYFFSFRFNIFIYLISQCALFGVSGIYHLYSKKNFMKRFLQRLDHATIFILIAGTQTATFLTFLPENFQKREFYKFIITTWSITFIGFFRALFTCPNNNLLNISFYIIHGVCCVPFFYFIYRNITYFDFFSFLSGGVIYIAGGIMFGCEVPDIWPEIFGFHEIWHIMTILGNTCFFIPILKKWIVTEILN